MRRTFIALVAALITAPAGAQAPCPDNLWVHLSQLGFDLASDRDVEGAISCAGVPGVPYAAFAAVLERRIDDPDHEALKEFDLLLGLAGRDGAVTSPTIQTRIGDNSAFFLTSVSLRPVGSHYGAPVFLAAFTSRNNSQVSYGTTTDGLLLRFTPEIGGVITEHRLLPLTRRFTTDGLVVESGAEMCNSMTSQLSHEITLVPKGRSSALTRRSRSTSTKSGNDCEETVERLPTYRVSVPTTSTWIEIPAKWEGEYAGDAPP